MSAWGYNNLLGDRRLLSALMTGAGTGARGLYTYEANQVACQMFFGSAGPNHWSAQPNEQLLMTERIAPLVNGFGLGASTVIQRFFNIAPTTGTLFTSPFDTQDSGSSLFVAVGRGAWASAAPAGPSENKGNTLVAIGIPTGYSAFPTSEAAVYADLTNFGGIGQIAQANWGASGSGNGDEVTIAAFEILGAPTLTSSSITPDTVGNPSITSNNVTTTSGAAMLVAVLFGNGNTGQTHVFTPTNGFTEWSTASADGDPNAGGYIQVATFYKYVATPGTYNATFTNALNEGAIVFLYAQQASTSVSYSASISETVTLSEAIAAVMAAIVGVSETASLSELLAAFRSTTGTASETVNLAESIAALYSAIPGLIETVTFSDAIAILTNFAAAINETVTLSDAVAIIAAFLASASETITLSEALAAGLLLTAGPSETVTLSEALAAQRAAIVGTPETVSLSESLGSLAAFLSSIAETVNLAEALSGGIQLLAGISETVNLSETLAAALGAAAAPTETVTVAEALGSLAGFAPALSDLVSLANALAAGVQQTATALETVPLGESVGASAQVLAGVSEIVSLANAITTQVAWLAHPAETILISELLAQTVGLHAAVAEIIAIAEAIDFGSLEVIFGDIGYQSSLVVSTAQRNLQAYWSDLAVTTNFYLNLTTNINQELINVSLTVKAGDQYPGFRCNLVSTEAFVITDAIAINFVWRLHNSSDRKTGTMAILDAPTNKVGYNWAAGDTLVPGTYDAQVELVFPGSLKMTFPNKGFYTFIITPTI